MPEFTKFTELLKQIDVTLDRYNPGKISPDKVLGEIIAERAKQRPTLEKAIQLASEGLTRYPFNAELLRRRAFARCRVVTPEGNYPELDAAEEDLRMILEYDPNNLYAALDLLEIMFTFSGMKDSDLAEVADKLAPRAEKLLLGFRSLQIKALSHAGKNVQVDEVYERWSKLFPESTILQSAKEDAEFWDELGK